MIRRNRETAAARGGSRRRSRRTSWWRRPSGTPAVVLPALLGLAVLAVAQFAAAGGGGSTPAPCQPKGVPKSCDATCDNQKKDDDETWCKGTLIVKKVVVNNDEGTKQASDFQFSVDGGPAVFFEADGENAVVVSAGVHSVVESPAPGYTATLDNCTDVQVPAHGVATCTITNNDDEPGQGALGVEITKTPSPASLPLPGGEFSYAVVVHNTSAVPVWISSLTDSVEGGPDVPLTGACGALVGQKLEADDSLAGGPDEAGCSFTLTFTGNSPATQSDTVKVAVGDDAKGTASASATAQVELTPPEVAPPVQPPTPPSIVPPPSIVAPPSTMDLAVVKSGPGSIVGPSSPATATVTWTVTFSNNGPASSTNVTAFDSVGGLVGVVFTSVVTQPAAGTCTIAPDGASISCALGTMASGEVRTAVFQGTVDSTVTSFTNRVTVTGEGTDTNLSNNTSIVPTTVLAPPLAKPPVAAKKPTVKPKKPTVKKPKPALKKPKPALKPKAKPKPKPKAKKPKPAVKKPKKAEICNTITVAQKTLQGNGKPQVVSVSVSKGRSGGKGVKGARVVLTGPGIKLFAVTNSNGSVTIPVRPRRAGILKLEIKNKKACNTQRIGIVATFEPPVAG